MEKIKRQTKSGWPDQSGDKAPIVPEKRIPVVPDSPLPIVPPKRK